MFGVCCVVVDVVSVKFCLLVLVWVEGVCVFIKYLINVVFKVLVDFCVFMVLGVLVISILFVCISEILL